MRSVTPSIESAVSRLAPGFRALSIVVESAPVADPAVAEQALAEACLAVQQDDVPWAQAHLAAWDEAFSAFGAKAKRTPCSAQALRKRVLKEGSLPTLELATGRAHPAGQRRADDVVYSRKPAGDAVVGPA